MIPHPPISTPEYTARLDRLRLLARRLVLSRAPRPSTRHALSGLVRDRRGWSPGDDLRAMDWALLARTGRPYTRLYEERDETDVWILVDGSRSMGCPSGEKLPAVRCVAGALAGLALAAGDRVHLQVLGSERPPVAPAASPAGLARLLRALDGWEPDGRCDLRRGVRRLLDAARRGGRVVIVSDFWLGPEQLHSLEWLPVRRLDPVLVPVWSRSDVEPPPGEGAILVDAETGERRTVRLDEATRKGHREAVARHLRHLTGRAARAGGVLSLQRSWEPFEKGVLGVLRAGRFLP